MFHLSGKDDVLDIEIDSYIHCISAFVKLAQSEYALLTEIIPEHHQKKTFDSLIQVRDAEIWSFYCRFGFLKVKSEHWNETKKQKNILVTAEREIWKNYIIVN